MTEYRIYANGTVVHQDDFREYDSDEPYYEDYYTTKVPDELVNHLQEGEEKLFLVVEALGNFLRGLSIDPRLPKYAVVAIQERLARVDSLVDDSESTA